MTADPLTVACPRCERAAGEACVVPGTAILNTVPHRERLDARGLEPMGGLLMVVDVRLQALGQAIRERNWSEVEWQFDRVRSALDKAQAGGAPRGAGGRPA